MPAQYTHGHTSVVVDAHALRTAAEAAAFVLPELCDGARILDLGCGPGSITIGLAEQVARGRVIGLDRVPDVLQRAAGDAARAGMSNLHLVAGEAARLPFADGVFDVVYAHQVLQHVAEPVAVLTEARRVLRRGGIVAVRDADFGTMTHHPHEPWVDRWLECYVDVARANGGEPEAGRCLLEWVRGAGFVDCVASTSTWTYADDAGRRAWSELWADRILLDPFAASAIELGVASRTDLERIGEGFRAWAMSPDGWFAFIHGEVLGRKP